jgi:hypothetical protein
LKRAAAFSSSPGYPPTDVRPSGAKATKFEVPKRLLCGIQEFTTANLAVNITIKYAQQFLWKIGRFFPFHVNESSVIGSNPPEYSTEKAVGKG